MKQNPSTTCAQEIVTNLVAAGVRDIVLAPGSRSAPLAYALAAAAEAGWCRVHVSIDERSGAFIALGLAREAPTAMITTSGTAAANLHPAVLEASHGHLPLLVLTADRPHELRGVGANQTTDQVKIFGAAVRQAWEIPAASHAAQMAKDVVLRAVTAATGRRTRNAGPVHFNVAFADPLTPEQPWQPGPAPDPMTPVTPVRAGEVVHLSRGPATVVIAGDGAPTAAARAVTQWGWPVLAEPSSGLRSSEHCLPAGYLLADQPGFGDDVERVVVLGRPTLHRSIARLLARTDLEIVVLAAHSDWTDVAGTATRICDQISVPGEPTPSEQQWWNRWQRAGQVAEEVLNHRRELDGPAVAREVLARPGTVLLGSSMAVRHADLGGPVGAAVGATAIHANRGLAGIDGTLATATGLALRGRQVRALVGDLTFQHDATSLIRGRLEEEVDLQVLVLDDGGGSIFATMEHGRLERGQWGQRSVFERYFQAPQQFDLAGLARAVGARYDEVHTLGGLRALLADPVRGRSVVRIPLPDAALMAAQQLANSILTAVT